MSRRALSSLFFTSSCTDIAAMEDPVELHAATTARPAGILGCQSPACVGVAVHLAASHQGVPHSTLAFWTVAKPSQTSTQSSVAACAAFERLLSHCHWPHTSTLRCQLMIVTRLVPDTFDLLDMLTFVQPLHCGTMIQFGAKQDEEL